MGLLAAAAGIFYLMGVRLNGGELITSLKNENAALKKAKQADKDKIDRNQETQKADESQITALQQKIEGQDARSVSFLKQIKTQKEHVSELGQGNLQTDDLIDALLKEKQTLEAANEQFAEELRALRDPEKQKASQISALLKAAAKYLQNNYLTQLPGINAYETYLKVLKLDPRNDKAQKGLKQIASEYYDKANRFYKSKNYDKAAKFVARGLNLAPEHKDLLALKQKIERKKNVKTPKPTPEPVVSSNTRVTHPRISSPRTVSQDELRKVFKLDKKWRPKQYVPITSNRFQKIKNGQVIEDNATGLMWQQAGSPKHKKYKAARQYIKKLNNDRFAGYFDWRLPTVDELTSLLTKTKQNGDLYIHPVFDKQQRWCWSTDQRASGGTWGVSFTAGVGVNWGYLVYPSYARAVRARQSMDVDSELALNQKIERKKNVEKPNPTPEPVVFSNTNITHPRISSPRTVSDDEFRTVFKLDENRQPKQYVPITSNRFQKIKNDQIIKDNSTGLMWQQSGSSEVMKYKAAQQYIKKLNSDRFAGYYDWRLPTVDVLTSLLTKTKQNGNLHIHSLFDKKQLYCWSSDKRAPGGVWFVSFYYGEVYWPNLGNSSYVRAVRAGQ